MGGTVMGINSLIFSKTFQVIMTNANANKPKRLYWHNRRFLPLIRWGAPVILDDLPTRENRA